MQSGLRTYCAVEVGVRQRFLTSKDVKKRSFPTVTKTDYPRGDQFRRLHEWIYVCALPNHWGKPIVDATHTATSAASTGGRGVAERSEGLKC
jgi:hypothetical protein